MVARSIALLFLLLLPGSIFAQFNTIVNVSADAVVPISSFSDRTNGGAGVTASLEKSWSKFSTYTISASAYTYNGITDSTGFKHSYDAFPVMLGLRGGIRNLYVTVEVGGAAVYERIRDTNESEFAIKYGFGFGAGYIAPLLENLFLDIGIAYRKFDPNAQQLIIRTGVKYGF